MMWNSHLFFFLEKRFNPFFFTVSPTEAEKPSPKWVRLFLKGMNDSFLTGTMQNSPTEATTTFFLTGSMWNSPTEAEKPPPKWVRPFLTGTMRNSPTEAMTTFFLTGTMWNSPTEAEKPLQNEWGRFCQERMILFWRKQCETHLPRLRRPFFLTGTMWISPTEAEKPRQNEWGRFCREWCELTYRGYDGIKMRPKHQIKMIHRSLLLTSFDFEKGWN